MCSVPHTPQYLAGNRLDGVEVWLGSGKRVATGLGSSQ